MDKQTLNSPDAAPAALLVRRVVRFSRRFHRRKSQEPISLERFAGLESLYAVGPLELARGEISIFDSVPLISEVHDSRTNVSVDFSRRAAFLVYAIVENLAPRNARQTDRRRTTARRTTTALRGGKRHRRRSTLSLLAPLPCGAGNVSHSVQSD